MTGWPVLDVAIGLSFLFFLLSLVCSSVNESIATALNWRAKNLERWIGGVLSDPSQLEKITPAIEQVLTDANVPAGVHGSVIKDVAAATSDTTAAVTDGKAEISATLKAAKISAGTVTDLVGKVFAAAESAQSTAVATTSSRSAARTVQKSSADEFFAHPAVQPLIKQPRWGPATVPLTNTPRKGRRPSYVPASTFATVVLNQATGGHAGEATAGQVIANLPAGIGAAVSDIGHAATNVATDGAADLIALRTRIEHWYDESMQRVAGWYKRKVQVALAVIALILCAGVNVDTFGVANSLWSDSTLRSAIVANAGRTVANSSSVPTSQGVQKDLDSVHQLNLPLGWGRTGSGSWNTPTDFGGWASKIGGILLSTFALLLGAPFWFDVLGRLFQFRGTGAHPATTAGQPATAGHTGTAGHAVTAAQPVIAGQPAAAGQLSAGSPGG